jgi:hypothetical protein
MDGLPLECSPPRLQRQQVRLLHASYPLQTPHLHCRVFNKNHMYDATEIFRTLPSHQKETYFKLAFYLLSFFYYLYRYASTCAPFPLRVI